METDTPCICTIQCGGCPSQRDGFSLPDPILELGRDNFVFCHLANPGVKTSLLLGYVLLNSVLIDFVAGSFTEGILSGCNLIRLGAMEGI